MSEPSVSGSAAAQKDGTAVLLWAVGMFCIFGWDWLINLPHEIERIWQRKLTYVSWLYILARYYGLMENAFNIVLLTRPVTGAITYAQCLTIFKWQPVSALISIQMSQTILGLRVYALYGKSKYVAAGLSLIQLAELAVQAKTMTVVFPVPEPPGMTIPCIAIGPQKWLIAFWAMPLVFDTTVFILTLAKSIDIWRRDIPSRKISAFFHDGLIYFAGIFTMNMINVIIFVTQDGSLQAVNLPATLMLNTMLACRLVLNLRAPNVMRLDSNASRHSRLTHTGMGDTVSMQDSAVPSYGMEPIGNKIQKSPGNIVMINTFREVDDDKGRAQKLGPAAV